MKIKPPPTIADFAAAPSRVNLSAKYRAFRRADTPGELDRCYSWLKGYLTAAYDMGYISTRDYTFMCGLLVSELFDISVKRFGGDE